MDELLAPLLATARRIEVDLARSARVSARPAPPRYARPRWYRRARGRPH